MFFAACSANNKDVNQLNSNNMEADETKITKEVWGEFEGEKIYLFSLRNKAGMIVKVSNYGGIINSIQIPVNNQLRDVVLGFDKFDDYRATGYLAACPYFGAVIGRYANRIANGQFKIDGKEYKIAQNNGVNHLHGGIVGFDKKVWAASEFETDSECGVELQYLSPDMEEGYPGDLQIVVTFSLNQNNELAIKYKASTNKTTVLNLTHHSYFNLSGNPAQDILQHQLQIIANQYIPVNENVIPTGIFAGVEGTAMDFRTMQTIGSRIEQVNGGYDHTYVANNLHGINLIAKVVDPQKMLVMEVLTNQPGVQFYTGNFLNGTITGKNEIVYRKHSGFCLETQHFPDSPNQPQFPSTLLKAGQLYDHTTIYRFSIVEN